MPSPNDPARPPQKRRRRKRRNSEDPDHAPSPLIQQGSADLFQAQSVPAAEKAPQALSQRAPALLPASARRSTRIVSVCIRGFHGDPAPITSERAKTLDCILFGLLDHAGWDNLDAVLLPGGYFHLKRSIGALDPVKRKSALAKTQAGRAAAEASKRLHRRWPGIILCIGFDAEPISKRLGGDQMMAAWRDGRLVGLARKSFPADADTNRRRHVYAISSQDFDAVDRLVALPNGAQAILCACYDAFGLRATVDAALANFEAATTLLRAKGKARNRSEGKAKGKAKGLAEALAPEDRERLLAQWIDSLRRAEPDLALVAIHAFKRPGRDGLWQRHGIAGASAALHGAPVVGAAHFNKQLPIKARDSPLASSGVAASHLTSGSRRKAERAAPKACLPILNPGGRQIAIARLFDFPGQD